MEEWVQRLTSLSENGASPDEIPGLRLLQFFESMVLEKDEEGKVFETGKTRGISKNLRACGGFNQKWVDGNVRVWREVGFLP